MTEIPGDGQSVVSTRGAEVNGGNKENVCLHPEHLLGDCRSRHHLTLDRGRVHACTPTHIRPHSFYKGLYTHTTHTHTYLLILKGLYRRPPEIYSGSQSVFFTSTAGLLSSGQKGPCPQSGQKVTGVEQRRTSPGLPGQWALAPSSRLCF